MSEKINKISTLFSKATGQELNMNTYDHRLMLQKLVYIVQEAGIKFGYSYNWYVKGPYCTELTRDSFEFFNHSQKIHKTTLTESENKLIESFKKYFKSDLKNDEKLELLGSLVFIIKDWEIKTLRM